MKLKDGVYDAMPIAGGEDFTVLRLTSSKGVQRTCSIELPLFDLPEFEKVRICSKRIAEWL
jgi:hypothetical protein